MRGAPTRILSDSRLLLRSPDCSNDESIVGGGWQASASNPADTKVIATAIASTRELGTNHWIVNLRNIGDIEIDVFATSECAKLVPSP